MADVESLELQITGDAKSAEQSIDSLIDTLGRLKTAAQGGSGLRAIANPLQKITKAVDSINGAGQKLKDLAGGLKTLSAESNFKISSNIANQINAINNAIKNITTDFTPIKNLFAAVQPLATMGKGGLGTLINQIKKLPEAVEALDKIDLDAFGAKIEVVANKMKPLADEMQKVANGFAAFPAKIQQFINASNKVPSANAGSAKSFANLAAKITALGYTLKRVGGMVASWINDSNEYVENLNLFTVAMGEYAGEAQKYAEQVGDAMGIDPAEWMRAQGVFMLLGTGFGVAGDRAAKMSQQLTQLGYDLSSIYNMPVEEAMQKLKSGFAGELEPLRSLGYDLSQAKLEAIALSLGIDKSVSSMTQAEKAELRYYAIMTQLTEAHHDMANTLDDPANQLRVLRAQVEQAARALGDLFIPILKTVLPYLIAAAKMVRYLANAFAGIFGGDSSETGESGMKDLATSAGVVSEEIDKATGSASKLKKTLLGIDELNVMSDPSSSGGGGGVGSGGGFDFELPTMKNWLDTEVGEEIDKIVEKMKKWLGITDDIKSWSDLFSTRLGNILTVVGLIGGAFAAWKIANSVVTGLEALKSFTAAHGKLGGVIGGVAGVGIAVTGLATIIKELHDNWDAIKNGDWSGVDKVLLAIGAIEMMGGIVTAIGFFNNIKSSVDTAKTAKNLTEVATVTETVSTTTSTVTQKLGSLVKNIGLGIAIIAEVAAAAIIFVGAIWVLGKELEQVGIAWEPVIANAGTVAIAMGIGTALLVAVGAVTALLGTLGGAVCGQIGIGIAILAELGVATLLFIAEIWAIGKGLDEVGKAWGPVLDNGEDIAKAIGIGTGLLVGIGVVTAALGVATVATAGALPVAIGLGTLLLVELTGAFIEFTECLIAVSDQLRDELHPSLDKTNAILPGLRTKMKNFTDFMKSFAGEVVTFTATNAIASIGATVNKVIDFFTADPIKSLSKEISKQCGQMEDLVEKLNEIVPVIQDADRLMAEFNSTMEKLKARTGINGNTPGTIGYTITVGVALAKSGWKSVSDWLGDLEFKLKFTMPKIKVNWSSKTVDGFTIQYPSSFSTYAKGGFPAEGEMFIAREAGPELVGSIGNRSAVVNNDQIVESVSRGVYQAVVSAMGQSGGNQVVEAKVNDKVLFEVVVNRNRQETMRTGYSPLLGGV
jgi:methyl-accepting chemotaxis protein